MKVVGSDGLYTTWHLPQNHGSMKDWYLFELLSFTELSSTTFMLAKILQRERT